MIQLILHLFGDFVLQSHWMAENKAKCSRVCALHALLYTLPFLILRPSVTALVVIGGSHFLIDRFRLARAVVWAKNVTLAPHDDRYRWSNCPNGYPSDVPAWLSVWLLIAADNALHIAINYFAITFL